MNAEQIITILDGDLKTGMCCCPAHDDKNPFFSVKDGDNGKPLVKCFAGCSQEAVIASLKERGAWPDTPQQIAPAELKAQKEAAARRKAERAEEDATKHAMAAKEAQQILQDAKGDPTQHPYVIKKGVRFGNRVKRGRFAQEEWADALLIPVYDLDGHVSSISAVNTDGEKKLLAGGKKQGCFSPLGKITGATGLIAVGEGLATVAAVCEVMGCSGVAAMDCGNLEIVAREVRKIAPDAEIVIIADDDQKPSSGDNPGKAAAMHAALAIKGKVAFPELEKKADAWDVWHEQGPEGIKAMMAAATVATVATVAVANYEIPSSTIECDLDLEPENIQRLRGALTSWCSLSG